MTASYTPVLQTALKFNAHLQSHPQRKVLSRAGESGCITSLGWSRVLLTALGKVVCPVQASSCMLGRIGACAQEFSCRQ